MPAGLRSLPPRIDVPDRLEAPFYPLRVSKGDGVVLYRLVSETRAEFGPSLVIVPRGRGRIIVVDHFLWHSSIEGREFTHVILPRLVNWAFERHP
jgi:hypothetical protein